MDPQNEFIELSDIFRKIRRRWAIFSLFLFLPIFIATVWSYTTPKRFFVTAIIKPSWDIKSPFFSNDSIIQLMKQEEVSKSFLKKIGDNNSDIHNIVKIHSIGINRNVEIIVYGKTDDEASFHLKIYLELFSMVKDNLLSRLNKEQGLNIESVDKPILLTYSRFPKKREHKLDIAIGIFVGILLSIVNVFLIDLSKKPHLV